MNMFMFEDVTKVDSFISSVSLNDYDLVRLVLAVGHEAEAYYQTTFQSLKELRLKAVEMYPRLTAALMADNSF